VNLPFYPLSSGRLSLGNNDWTSCVQRGLGSEVSFSQERRKSGVDYESDHRGARDGAQSGQVLGTVWPLMRHFRCEAATYGQSGFRGSLEKDPVKPEGSGGRQGRPVAMATAGGEPKLSCDCGSCDEPKLDAINGSPAVSAEALGGTRRFRERPRTFG